MEKIIEVHGLQKSFGKVQAVCGIEFCVERGKLFAFLGPNGAGKSTTIDMLCTLSRPDGGSALIDGYELGKEDGQIRKSIGVVFQDSMLDPLLTVRENLMTRARFYGMGRRELRAAVRTAAGTAGVSGPALRQAFRRPTQTGGYCTGSGTHAENPVFGRAYHRP